MGGGREGGGGVAEKWESREGGGAGAGERREGSMVREV